VRSVVVPGLGLLVVTAVAAGLLGILLSGFADRATPVAEDALRATRGVTEADERRVESLVDQAADWPGVDAVSGPVQIRRDFMGRKMNVPLDLVMRDDVSREGLTTLARELCGASASGLTYLDSVRASLRFESAGADVSCTAPAHADAIGSMLYEGSARGEASGLDWVSLNIAASEADSPPLVQIGLWPTGPASATRLETEWSSIGTSLGFSPAEAAVRNDPVPRTSATGN
jgi:hypothetical protein